MIGTLINVGTVLLGTGVGFLCKKGIPQRIEDAVMKTMGLAVVLIGLTGTLGAMGRVEGGAVSFDGGLLLLVSLVLGVLAGELLKIDDRLGRFGGFVERKLKIKGFAQGFVPAAVIFCVGAMAILGALEEGLTGDYSILLVKSTLDLVSAAVLTASSQARALPPLLGMPPPSTRVVTIGAPTALAAGRQGIAVAAQASSPTPDAIVRALIDALDRPVQADAPEERDS